MGSSCRICKKNLQANRLKKSEDQKKSNDHPVTTDELRSMLLNHHDNMRKLYKRPETSLQGLVKMLSERKKEKEAAEAEKVKTNDHNSEQRQGDGNTSDHASEGK